MPEKKFDKPWAAIVAAEELGTLLSNLSSKLDYSEFEKTYMLRAQKAYDEYVKSITTDA